MHQAFPRNHLYNYPTEPLGREILGIALFLQRYPAYRFTWWLEYDVRWVCSPDQTWTVLLNCLWAAISVIQHTPYLYCFHWLAQSIQCDDLQTGPSWGEFFNSAMNVAAATLQGKSVAKNDSILKASPPAETMLPDTIMFSTAVHGSQNISEHFQPRDTGAWSFPNMIPVGSLCMGVSHAYAQALTQHVVNGEAGYVKFSFRTARLLPGFLPNYM